MSLEQAIIDHAAAIRELAAAILGRVSAANVSTVTGGTRKAEPTDAQIDAEIDAKTEAQKHEQSGAPDEELEKAVAKVEAAAKAAKQNAADDAEKAAAFQAKIDADKAKEKNEGKSAAGTATPAADTQTTAGAADTTTDAAQTLYDYHKDVAPVLTKLAQKSRDSLVALLAEFGAKKGGELKPEQYAAVRGAANKLLAG